MSTTLLLLVQHVRICRPVLPSSPHPLPTYQLCYFFLVLTNTVSLTFCQSSVEQYFFSFYNSVNKGQQNKTAHVHTCNMIMNNIYHILYVSVSVDLLTAFCEGNCYNIQIDTINNNEILLCTPYSTDQASKQKQTNTKKELKEQRLCSLKSCYDMLHFNNNMGYKGHG